MKLRHRRFGANLRHLVVLSAFSAGCILVQLQARGANSQEQVQPALASLSPIDNPTIALSQTPPREGNTVNTAGQPKPANSQNNTAGNNGRNDQPLKPLPTDWLLKKDILSIQNGVWLSIWALLIGSIGACLGIWNWMQMTISNHENIKEIRELQKRFKALDLGIKSRTTTSVFEGKVSELGTQILALENHVRRQSKDFADLRVQLTSHLSDSPSNKDYHLGALATDVDYSRINLPSSFWTEAPQPATPPQPTSSDLLAALTALINRGDRQSFKKEVRSELNITDDSASLIATGRITQTELEEVAGGGSYWLVEIAGQTWLYPTDLTLSGFSQFQPSKGIFGYEKQQIPVPQVLTPALLEPLGSNWRIAQMGSIAVPG